MTRRILFSVFSAWLFATSSFAQMVDAEKASVGKSDVSLITYLSENIVLIAGTAAIASVFTASVFYCFGPAKPRKTELRKASPVGAPSPAEAETLVREVEPSRGEVLPLQADVPGGQAEPSAPPRFGADAPPVQADVAKASAPPQADVDAATAARAAQLKREQSRLAVEKKMGSNTAPLSRRKPAAEAVSSSSVHAHHTDTHQPTQSLRRDQGVVAESHAPLSALFARFGGGTDVAERFARGERPEGQVMPPRVLALNELVTALHYESELSKKEAIAAKILAFLETMSPAEIDEAARWPFFWEKLLSAKTYGRLFFRALTCEQLRAAMTGFGGFADESFNEVDTRPLAQGLIFIATALANAFHLADGKMGILELLEKLKIIAARRLQVLDNFGERNALRENEADPPQRARDVIERNEGDFLLAMDVALNQFEASFKGDEEILKTVADLKKGLKPKK